jgi:hypothetical protein
MINLFMRYLVYKRMVPLPLFSFVVSSIMKSFPEFDLPFVSCSYGPNLYKL